MVTRAAGSPPTCCAPWWRGAARTRVRVTQVRAHHHMSRDTRAPLCFRRAPGDIKRWKWCDSWTELRANRSQNKFLLHDSSQFNHPDMWHLVTIFQEWWAGDQAVRMETSPVSMQGENKKMLYFTFLSSNKSKIQRNGVDSFRYAF